MPDPTASGTAPGAETAREPEATKPEPKKRVTPAKDGRVDARVDALEEKVGEIQSGQNAMQGTLDRIVDLVTAQKAEQVVAAAPLEPGELQVVEWGTDGVYPYSSMHKDLLLIRTPGEKIDINGQVVVRHQQGAQFLEGQYIAPDEDWRDWIESHEMFRNGRVVRGVSLRAVPHLVHTGPKTSTQPERAPKSVARPHGELSAQI
jgi:hypothetical protein